ncbi:HipA N-terminal domain-containing protein [Chitinophaga arvensicola]|uniref:Serine/threonine-protein kinase HipA n=1 Tax=Chitinophaga arvensicola TaxID=29529 RepID=A0A1I0PK78_9BACT|nr:HipA N-terminal domain-containing protein [Chitinophaga arvensicola]SEW14752.1 serine/threonine-protein kinase HipA [Chitinophaga arvensicola]
MKTVQVFYNSKLAGYLSKNENRYRFVYDKQYLADTTSRPVSITLPLREPPYESDILFPVFVNLLSEGANKAIQNRLLRVDENDYFGLLLATAGGDHIGPLTIKEDHASASN